MGEDEGTRTDDSPDTMNRIDRDGRTLGRMLQIFCRAHHGQEDTLCGDCHRLLEYSLSRLISCPYRKKKPVCSRCSIHCYTLQRREQVRTVMRYSGPRMMLRYPSDALRHLWRMEIPFRG